MTSKEKHIILELKNHEKLFKEWLADNFSIENIKNEIYDATAYPNWFEIEITFERAFKELNFNQLKDEELNTCAFLLARQWNVGVIFPYFKTEISQLGMTEEQLLVLAMYGLKSNEWSFQQQCAASIYKAKKNQQKAIEIALNYYESKDADIRRHALHSLYKLKYPEIKRLIQQSYQLEDELEMKLCISIGKKLNIELVP